MPIWSGLTLLEANSVIIELITYFHDYMMALLACILGSVSYMFIYVINTSSLDSYTTDSHLLETIWTVVPIGFLLLMAFPSLYLLYLTEDTTLHSSHFKVVAHQWYWEYTTPSGTNFDSYMAPGSFRNLDVDNRLALPAYVTSQLLITSADVLHSFALPTIAAKVDCIPGRLNSLLLTPTSPSILYGQCSELCGANHSFIPICVEAF